MNSQFKQIPLESFDFATVDYVPASTVQQTRSANARERIVAAVTKRAQLLSVRGSAGLVLLIGFVAFAFSYVVARVLTNRLFLSDGTGVGVLQSLLVLSMAAGAAALAARRLNRPRPEGAAPRQIGQYRLLALLGTGGMGEVYLAEHRRLKRLCAIKLIRPERTRDAQILARFEREVRATAQLSHWNTVKIFDYGRTDDGTLYYAMEYLPGMNLEEMLQVDGRQPAERVIHLLRQACQALREAHAAGLIHRDIKPANLFVAECGGVYDVVKVLDFGLVKVVAEIPSARLTQHGALSGTPHFMSPEQASGLDEVDQRSDIYSLGAVAYTLLCGRPPFDSSHPLEVLIAHARDEVRPPSAIWPDVPVDLENVVLCCLAKKPEDRYQDMHDLEQALAQCGAADQWTQACAVRWWKENAKGTPQPRRTAC